MDREQLYGGSLPEWSVNGKGLPQIYKVITEKLSMTGTDVIDTDHFLRFLKESGLTQDLIGHIWSQVNKACLGQLNVRELRLALALVALAQVCFAISYPLFTGATEKFKYLEELVPSYT